MPYKNKYLEAQVQRARQTLDSHPYMIIYLGPIETPCVIHERFYDKPMKFVDFDFAKYPLNKSLDCTCHFRMVSNHEYKTLTEGFINELDNYNFEQFSVLFMTEIKYNDGNI